jgi:hypothetical protein
VGAAAGDPGPHRAPAGLFWPGDAREPCRLDEIDALEAETILLRERHALERLR